MSAAMHFYGRAEINCADEEPVLGVRTRHNTASFDLTPSNIEQLEAACAEARKYHAMAVIQQAARDEAERIAEPEVQQ